MRLKKALALAPVLLAALLDVGYTEQAQAPPLHSVDDLLGAWTEKGGDRLLRIESDRLVVYEAGQTRAVRIVESGPGTVSVRNLGVRETWSLSFSNGLLGLVRGGEVTEYKALPSTPQELDLTPLQLGQPGQIPADRLKPIQEELRRRRDLDQMVRKDPEKQPQREVVDRDNVKYLEELVREVGWIDAERFGAPASAAAILLAKHSADPRLMQAILPLVERDVRRSAVSAELFSVLFDGLRISLGEKQRFGTQLGEDDNGPFVVPLEDPDKVEAFRQEIGLQPLSDYLATASKVLYDGKPIRMPRPGE